MIKEALQYIVNLSKPSIESINGNTYSDKTLHRICHNPHAAPIKLNTLSSLIDYIRSGVDELHGRMIIHVQSPTRVQMYSALDGDRERECLVEVNALIPDFDFNQFTDHEKFCINLQSKCIDTGDRALLLKFAGTVEAGSVAEYGDDGVSQKATVKTGITTKTEALVPSPALLAPYRTFIEIEQPMSSFIFRLQQDKYNGIKCALFEADGGAWKIQAVQSIKAYLTEALCELPFADIFTIIS